jgi:predicted RNase H-like HicB family nuclease
MKKPTYPVVIEYSKEDRGYVARVPALKYCTAFGESYEEAAREIQVAIEGWVAVAKEKGTPIPSAGATIDELLGAVELLNLNEVARRIGVPAQTLYAKVRRRTALKADEALAVARTLNEAGLHLVAKAS